MNLISPINNSTLSFQVFESLQTAIFAKELRPGDPLREAHIARQLQVSQVPVREALLQLEHLGLVTKVPNKGTYVTQLTKREIENRVVVRAHLEEMAFIEAAKIMDENNYQELELLVRELADAIAGNNYLKTSQADLEFHRYIWRNSNNEVLYETLNHLTVPLFAFVTILRKNDQEDLKETIASHDGIIDALKSRDPKVIKKILKQHHEFSKSVPRSAG